jgi:serine/threonine protein phosphatase 1
MLKLLRSLLDYRTEPEVIPSIPDGQRVYAIGDIHGRYDLLCRMIARIEADEVGRPAAETTVILLGDLVDRGPDSAGVIATAREWAKRRNVRVLSGNHEEMFLASFERDDTLRHFLRHGGRETLLSYPIEPDVYSRATLEELRAIMHEVVPAEDIDFMKLMEDRIQIGDYVFVHAGVRPGVPLGEQKVSDLRWIRGEFIDGPETRNFAVVHGHTILEAPHVSPLRISLDTGAYSSGLLSAIGLEGTARWLISVQGEPAAEAA